MLVDGENPFRLQIICSVATTQMSSEELGQGVDGPAEHSATKQKRQCRYQEESGGKHTEHSCFMRSKQSLLKHVRRMLRSSKAAGLNHG